MGMWITCILFIVMNYIWMKLWSFHFHLDELDLENIQQQYPTLTFVSFHPNVDFVFLYQLFCWIILHSLSLTLCIFWCIIKKIIFILPTFHWFNNTNTRKMKWKFFFCGDVTFVMKDINNFLFNSKKFFTIISPLFYLSCMLSHNSLVILCLNGLNPCIKHLDMFWNKWNLFFEGNQ